MIKIPYKKIGKTLVGPAILLVKTLQGATSILATVFAKLFKVSSWLLRPFIWRPFLKLYGQYLLSLKNVREIKSDQEIKLAWLKKYAAPTLVAVLTVITSFYNLSLSGGNFNISEKMGRAVIASLVKDEFGQPISVSESITESAGNLKNIKAYSDRYPTGAVEPPMSIYTNTEAPKDNQSFSWLLNDYLFVPGKSSIGFVDTSNPEAPATNVARNQVIQYTVGAGDSISSIARKFGISVNTILWANNLTARSVIRQGNQLSILPQSGVMYKVVSGDSLQRIARKYGVDEDKIIAANNLNNAGSLKIGQQLVIPGGQKTSSSIASTPAKPSTKPGQQNIPKPGNTVISGTKMQWPTAGYRITQYYSWRHTGLDIANKVGTPLYAAESGTVESSGWSSGGYGYQVLINHGGGRKTRYAHASKLYVVAGQEVARGEVVAAMGSTGRSTGPHIHFEVIINGVRVNPLNYIR